MKSKRISVNVFTVALVLILTAVFLGGIAVFAAEDETEILPGVSYELGDVNLDKSINIKDTTAIQKYAAELISLSPFQEELADIDRNSDVNVKDATYIQKLIAGLIDHSEPATEDAPPPVLGNTNATAATSAAFDKTEPTTETQVASATEPSETDTTEPSTEAEDNDDDSPITLPFIPAP